MITTRTTRSAPDPLILGCSGARDAAGKMMGGGGGFAEGIGASAVCAKGDAPAGAACGGKMGACTGVGGGGVIKRMVAVGAGSGVAARASVAERGDWAMRSVPPSR
jgi:hypothetical protein